MNAWVYILRCADQSFYVGSARGSLEHRIGQHHAGEMAGYTSTRRPVTLVWSTDFQFIRDAVALERQLKGWSRAKKEALIRGDYNLLPVLASRGKVARSLKASFETRPSGAPQNEERAGISGALQDEDT